MDRRGQRPSRRGRPLAEGGGRRVRAARPGRSPGPLGGTYLVRERGLGPRSAPRERSGRPAVPGSCVSSSLPRRSRAGVVPPSPRDHALARITSGGFEHPRARGCPTRIGPLQGLRKRRHAVVRSRPCPPIRTSRVREVTPEYGALPAWGPSRPSRAPLIQPERTRARSRGLLGRLEGGCRSRNRAIARHGRPVL
jgi:hypothetical protein